MGIGTVLGLLRRNGIGLPRALVFWGQIPALAGVAMVYITFAFTGSKGTLPVYLAVYFVTAAIYLYDYASDLGREETLPC